MTFFHRHRRRALAAALAAAVLGQAAPAAAAEVLGLDQCLDRALAHSPELEIADRTVAVAEARERQARWARWLPKFEAVDLVTLGPALDIAPGGLLDLETRNDWSRPTIFNRLSVQFVQPLYTFGRLRNLAAAASHGVAAEEAARRSVADRTAAQVIAVYYARVLSAELRRIAEESESIAAKVERRLNEELADGTRTDLSQADLYEVRLFRFEIRERLREIAKNRELALAALAALIAATDATAIEVADRFLDPVALAPTTITAARERARSQRPELARLDAAIAGARALVEVDRAGMLPEFFVAGEAAVAETPGRDHITNPFLSDPFSNGHAGLALGVRVPLDLHHPWAQTAKRRMELELLQAQRDGLRVLTDLEVERAHRTATVARANVQTRNRARRLAKEWRLAEEIVFDLDATNAGDLVDAVEAELKRRAQYFEAVFQYNVAMAQLLRTIGGAAEQWRDG